MLHAGSRQVGAVLEYLDTSREMAHDVLIGLGRKLTLMDWLGHGWSVEVLGRFAELLARHFPPPDVEVDGVHWVGPEKNLRTQRDRCLALLVELAGEAGWTAVDELGRLERLFPAWAAAPFKRRQAVELAGMGTWSPPAPVRVLAIARGEWAADTDTNGLALLEDFLVEHFTAGELRRLVARLENGRAIASRLIGDSASLVQVATSVVGQLWRAARINAELFAVMITERPVYQAEIKEIARELRVGCRSD